ncbi:NfeD family protein [Aeromonas simiae]|uniref:NfeD family protein n=1 Tax=Aeromonas simiae TaxID=218936 RepID=A0A5J6WT14_9GAMM|nr:NfeD family protein [Aeromonas simiae]QFI54022.1 NfeD family protein [Aeromonas simiae]
MSEWLTTLSHWHWLGLGCLLLVIEVSTSVGLLLWTGIAALEVGLLLLLFPFGWQGQWLLFALQATLTTWLWWRWQHRRDQAPHDAASGLNQRLQGYMGREVILLDAVAQGQSRVRLDDTVWSVICDEPLPAGSTVKVVGADSHRLKVIPLSPESSPD